VLGQRRHAAFEGLYRLDRREGKPTVEQGITGREIEVVVVEDQRLGTDHSDTHRIRNVVNLVDGTQFTGDDRQEISLFGRSSGQSRQKSQIASMRNLAFRPLEQIS